jgi:membrane protein DedA with SNARE-associated domain
MDVELSGDEVLDESNRLKKFFMTSFVGAYYWCLCYIYSALFPNYNLSEKVKENIHDKT